MKKSAILMSVAFVLAIGSAFTSKLVNPTGYKVVSGATRSGETNNANCAVQASGTDCSFQFSGSPVSPVYSSAAAAEATPPDASEILRF
jgi:hypothetical protein